MAHKSLGGVNSFPEKVIINKNFSKITFNWRLAMRVFAVFQGFLSLNFHKSFNL